MKLWHLALAAGFAVPAVASAQLGLVTYDSLTATETVTFEDILGGTFPGTNYDSIFFSNGVGFAERFVGQTLTDLFSTGFDRLGGLPSGGSLTLLAGAAGQNLNVLIDGSSQRLAGLGSAGFPLSTAIGEGAFAALFSTDQSQFGFQLLGANGGTFTISFFRADGTLIQTISVLSPASTSYGFLREGGLQDIRGVSIYNNDGGGVVFDNLRFDVQSFGGAVPEPVTWAMMLLGFGAIGATMRRRSRTQDSLQAT